MSMRSTLTSPRAPLMPARRHPPASKEPFLRETSPSTIILMMAMIRAQRARHGAPLADDAQTSVLTKSQRLRANAHTHTGDSSPPPLAGAGRDPTSIDDSDTSEAHTIGAKRPRPSEDDTSAPLAHSRPRTCTLLPLVCTVTSSSVTPLGRDDTAGATQPSN